MNLVVIREALERFSAELPAGLHADRLRRLSDATRALVEQALAQRGGDLAAAWAMHDLGVVVAEALSHPATEEPGKTLFIGVRRRLAEGLAADPDDLALALAITLGVAHGDADDPRAPDDLTLVAGSLDRPHVGPRLVAAAVHMVGEIARRRSREDAPLAAAAAAAAPTVRAAADRLVARLPMHPDLALDRVRLSLLAARTADGEERARALSEVRGLMRDHEQRFGPTRAGRDVLAAVVGLEARAATAPSDLRRDALRLIEADVRERTLSPKRTTRLVRAIQRARGLDKATAEQITDLLSARVDGDDPRWFETRGLLLSAANDEAALLRLWERAIAADADDKHAARGLLSRLVRNLREGLAAPFDASVIDRVLAAAPPQAMAKWSAEDVDRVLTMVSTTFGAQRAADFIRHKLLDVRELRGKDFLWKRALDVARELGEDTRLDIARKAVRHRDLPEARLLLAETLLGSGDRLGEADDVLRPLYDKKGAHGAAAHALRQRITGSDAYRDQRLNALLAYESQLGIGTPKKHALKIVYTARNYALAEATEKPAPEFYEHKHLRTMIRAEDLPKGIHPTDLQKGDVVHAPLRGQMADPSRDKDGLRVYWLADNNRLEVGVTAEEIAARWQREEQAFGIGGGAPVPLKVVADKRKKRLYARILDAGGNDFRATAAVDAAQLPSGVAPEKLGGKGRRMWGVVEGTSGAERRYVVVGTLLAEDPNAEAPAAPTADAPPTEAKPAHIGQAGATTQAAPAQGAPSTQTAPTTTTEAAATAEAPRAETPKPDAETPKAETPTGGEA